MDVYLAQRCSFCISTSTGYDALPLIFRKPICFITVPVGLLFTFSDKFISITKNHYSRKLNRFLTLNEIFDYDLSILKKKNDFELQDIELVENSEEEINSLVLEMHNQLNGKESISKEEKKMQDIFWKQYKSNIYKRKEYKSLHGSFKAKLGNKFLLNNMHLNK